MPTWVSEGSVRKYNRAVAQLTKEKKEVTEAAIKELYVLWGGLVIGDEASVQGVSPQMDKEAIMEVATEEVKTKRGHKK